MADLTPQRYGAFSGAFSPSALSYLSAEENRPVAPDQYYPAQLVRNSAMDDSTRIDYYNSLPPSPPTPPPHPSFPMLNNKPIPMQGHGLRSLADIAVKAEVVMTKIQEELAASKAAKICRSIAFAEHRGFIRALYDLEQTIAGTAVAVEENIDLFRNIDTKRTTISFKDVSKAMRELCRPLQRMAVDCGHKKYVRICRKYVVRVLRRMVHHYEVSLGRHKLLQS